MKSISRACYLVAVVCVISLQGCGSGDNANRVPVSGSILLDGKPLDGGMVAFIGGGGGALATASTDKEGKFQIQVASGLNKVTVSKDDPAASIQTAPKSDADMLMGLPEQVKQQQKSMPKSIVPAKYSRPDTSGLSFDIKSGMEPLSISLSSK